MSFEGLFSVLQFLPVFFGILLVLVMIHEAGHFVTAKLARITVEEFAFGFPPRLFSVRFRGTDYSVNWLPLGGYVKMMGEEDPHETGSFASKPAWIRLIVLAAGSGMNFVLAVGLFSASFMIPSDTVLGTVEVREVMPGSPAAMAGMETGDLILHVNEREITSIPDLQIAIRLNLGSPARFEIERAGAGVRYLDVTPRVAPPSGEGETGIMIGLLDPIETQVSYPIWEAVPRGLRQSFDLLTLSKNGIWAAFSRESSAPAVAGPVGMFQATEAIAATGPANLLSWVAVISMSLAIFNMLPIPGLDGGRFSFVLLEILRRGRRISPERESMVHLAGFVFLIGLMVIVSYFDIARIVNGEGPFG